MENKAFIQIPKGRFEKIMLSAKFAQNFGGKKVTRSDVMDLVERENLHLTDEQKEQILNEFPA